MHTCRFEFDGEWSGSGYSVKKETCDRCLSVRITHTIQLGNTKTITETVVPGFAENFREELLKENRGW